MKQTVEEAAREYADKNWPNGRFNCTSEVSFIAGAEWQKEQAIEALSSVLDNWIHGGDADCIIAEFEEKLK